ncbi:MmcQ/YjbR family DNA-binding protein [Microlunatus parietis]|uniref:Putative DNA-binding protein (MmcQ/YjbR family) n=1 Tax=Microlunatus parietis TaxID=682979 RepID=A0A7Y9LDE2_9ACTN|nr:MmcQ/YjbR family DNA-binding protein [Microlunatus parietis]NYE72808.1 putative DNA-binding protein (MmcQ/YjbR family) [Microlunatus parietis]
MTRDEVLELCLSLPGAVEDYPFGDDLAVIKVGGKIFALLPLGGEPGTVSLKCNPALALELRDRHPGVVPGYHLNKRHWNTIILDGSVPGDEVAELIEHSYELVVASLTRAVRATLPDTSR